MTVSNQHISSINGISSSSIKNLFVKEGETLVNINI